MYTIVDSLISIRALRIQGEKPWEESLQYPGKPNISLPLPIIMQDSLFVSLSRPPSLSDEFKDKHPELEPGLP